jgi:hypothetical protein
MVESPSKLQNFSSPTTVRDLLQSAATNRESAEESLASFDSRNTLHAQLLEERRNSARSTQQICDLQQVYIYTHKCVVSLDALGSSVNGRSTLEKRNIISKYIFVSTDIESSFVLATVLHVQWLAGNVVS